MRKVKKEFWVGVKLNLTCKAIGKPTPIVTWHKDGKIYERSHDGQRPGPYDYQLEFSGLDIADCGSYMCNVSNAFGFLTFTYNLTVQGQCFLFAIVVTFHNFIVSWLFYRRLQGFSSIQLRFGQLLGWYLYTS